MPEIGPGLVALGLAWYAAFLFSTCCHEAAHAWAALRLGDPTAYLGGQVSLDPRPHVVREPIGTVVVPILTFALTRQWMMGWASAPYDPAWADRHPRRAAWMALAGPAANFSLVILAGLAIRAGVAIGWFSAPEQANFSNVVVGDGGLATGAATLLSVLFSLNLVLGIFNLLPLPPLDGSAALFLLLPERLGRAWLELLRMPMLGLVGILVAWRLFPYLFLPVHTTALNLLWPEHTYLYR
ncbi:MAG TPA: site-2 protease family protein [Thermoanaerobaculia bacterium]|nr:site-2 protease family protein [Thermoanaerobaculia bacterium]